MTQDRINMIVKSVYDAAKVSGVFIDDVHFTGECCEISYETMDAKKSYAFAKSYDELSRDGKLGFNRNIVSMSEYHYSFTTT